MPCWAPAAPRAPRLVEGDHVVTYADADARPFGSRVDELDLPPRSLVVLEAANTVSFVTTYLALLDGGHVPLLTGAHAPALADGVGCRRHRRRGRPRGAGRAAEGHRLT